MFDIVKSFKGGIHPQYNKETSQYDIVNLNISVSVKAYILHDGGLQGG